MGRNDALPKDFRKIEAKRQIPQTTYLDRRDALAGSFFSYEGGDA